jgi:glutamyl-tRNA reductase
MKNAEKIRRSHLDSTVKKLSPLSDEERYNLEMMTRAIVRNILKDPIDNIKANGHSNRGYTEMVKDLFKLDEEKGR